MKRGKRHFRYESPLPPPRLPKVDLKDRVRSDNPLVPFHGKPVFSREKKAPSLCFRCRSPLLFWIRREQLVLEGIVSGFLSCPSCKQSMQVSHDDCLRQSGSLQISKYLSRENAGSETSVEPTHTPAPASVSHSCDPLDSDVEWGPFSR